MIPQQFYCQLPYHPKHLPQEPTKIFKSPGFDLITAEIAQKLPSKAIIHLAHIYYIILRISYFLIQWKFSRIILSAKPNKPLYNTYSYRPISLLSFFSKLYEKLILNQIYPIIIEKNINS